MSRKAQAVVQLRLSSSVCCGLSKSCNVYFCFALLLVAVKSCTLLRDLLHRLQTELRSAPGTTKEFLQHFFINSGWSEKNLRENITFLIYGLFDKCCMWKAREVQTASTASIANLFTAKRLHWGGILQCILFTTVAATDQSPPLSRAWSTRHPLHRGENQWQKHPLYKKWNAHCKDDVRCNIYSINKQCQCLLYGRDTFFFLKYYFNTWSIWNIENKFCIQPHTPWNATSTQICLQA